VHWKARSRPLTATARQSAPIPAVEVPLHQTSGFHGSVTVSLEELQIGGAFVATDSLAME
jgi:hypothetical protein